MASIKKIKTKWNLIDDIKKLSLESSKVKSNIFKAVISDEYVNMTNMKYYLSYVNGLLGSWEEFAEDLDKDIKSTTARVAVYSVSYNSVKDYLYGKFDYGAATDFASSLIRFINEGKFDSKSDVDDFFADTVSKAFGNHGYSVAALTDNIVELTLSDNYTKSLEDVKMFNTLAGHAEIVNERDRATLYNSVKKTIEFISDKEMIKKYINRDNTSVFVATINNIIEFVTYSVAAYISRIYVIFSFAYPYIRNSDSDRARIIESVDVNKDNLPSTGRSIDNIGSTIFRDADESKCKDPKIISYFIDTFENGCTAIGGNQFIKRKPYIHKNDSDVTCYDKELMDQNMFAQALMNNDIYNFFIDDKEWNPYVASEAAYNERLAILKTFVSNPHKGLGDHASSKDELLAVIRGKTHGNTLKELQQDISDLYIFAVIFIACINSSMCSMIAKTVSTANDRDRGIRLNSTQNTSQAIIKLTNDLYSEIVYALLQKGREIETKYNNITTENVNNIIGLDVPGGIKEIGTTSDITNAVPDSNRVPIDLTDLYALPAFEHFQFYDEMVKCQYGLEDDIYYSEAFNISELLNKLKALIIGKFNSFKNWINNEKRQSAFNYVRQHEQELLKLTFGADQQMGVLPFKNNGNEEIIDIGKVLNTILAGLDKFNPEILNSPDSVNNFIKTLYPNETVYKWFTSKDVNPKDANNRFRNWVLYQDDLNQVTPDATKGEIIKGAEISKRLKWWIDTCKNSNQLINTLERFNNNILSKQDGIKSKVSNIIGNTSGTSSTNVPTDPTANSNNKNEDKPGNNNNTGNQKNDKSDNSANNEKVSNFNLLLTEFELLHNRIYFRIIMDICPFYFSQEYKYIKEAYSLSKGNAAKEEQK